jgi:hypothetical protein
MRSEDAAPPAPLVENAFTAADVAAILHERGWLAAEHAMPSTASPAAPALNSPQRTEGSSKDGAPEAEETTTVSAWLEAAAALLGPQAADHEALADLLGLVFHYDAPALLATPEAHEVLARAGAREVIRELALLVLPGRALDSAGFKEVVSALKAKLRYRGRELFGPIRLVLAGRTGEGELDRVILLLDHGARLPFRMPVKGARQRIIEFCAALD